MAAQRSLAFPAHAKTNGSHNLKIGGALRAQAAQKRAVPTVINHTGFCCAPADPQGSIARAALQLTCALAFGMARRSHANMPVLEEWHIAHNRPHACGVEGCALQLVTKKHFLARLCAAHIKCPAVLRGGVPQRWCTSCGAFHTLEAFSAIARCAPASCWRALVISKTDVPVCGQVCAVCISQCSRWLNQYRMKDA